MGIQIMYFKKPAIVEYITAATQSKTVPRVDSREVLLTYFIIIN